MAGTQLHRGIAALREGLPTTVVAQAIARASAEGWSRDVASAYCPRCGATVGEQAVTPEGCPFCVGTRPPWHRITRLGAYGEPMAEWVKAMKFGRQWRFARWMGQELAAVLDGPPGRGRPLVVPVPMHWRRRFSRGYNQAALMAETIGRTRGWPVAHVLRRVRHAPPQSTVAVSDRPGNIRRCFAAHRVDLTGRDILLVDDVKTTGATLRVCARLLRRHGARSIHAAVAAVADPQGQRFTAN